MTTAERVTGWATLAGLGVAIRVVVLGRPLIVSVQLDELVAKVVVGVYVAVIVWVPALREPSANTVVPLVSV